MKSVMTALFLFTAIVPAHAGSILDAVAPDDSLRVEFKTMPDTDVLKTGQPISIGVLASRSTGDVQIDPTSIPEGMSYDATTQTFSGIPVLGDHELAVDVVDRGTGQRVRAILDLHILPR